METVPGRRKGERKIEEGGKHFDEEKKEEEIVGKREKERKKIRGRKQKRNYAVRKSSRTGGVALLSASFVFLFLDLSHDSSCLTSLVAVLPFSSFRLFSTPPPIQSIRVDPTKRISSAKEFSDRLSSLLRLSHVPVACWSLPLGPGRLMKVHVQNSFANSSSNLMKPDQQTSSTNLPKNEQTSSSSSSTQPSSSASASHLSFKSEPSPNLSSKTTEQSTSAQSSPRVLPLDNVSAEFAWVVEDLARF